MRKTTYICLIAMLFSLLGFANGGYDEYGSSYGSSYGSPIYNTGAANGGNFWSNNVSRMVANNGGIPMPGSTQNYYTYSYVTQTKEKSSTSYNESHIPSNDPNKISEYNGKSPSTGWDVWRIYPATTVLHEVQNTVSLPQANNYIMNTYGPNTYFNFNIYDPYAHVYHYNTYHSSSTGVVPVATFNTIVPAEMEIPYNLIPRTSPRIIPDGSRPDTPFHKAAQLFRGSSTLTLPEALDIIVYFIDGVGIPDTNGSRKKAILDIIGRVREGLPADQKDRAEEIVIEYELKVKAVYNELLDGAETGSSEKFEFAKELTNLTLLETSVDSNAISFVLEAKKQNKIYDNFDETFINSIDQYLANNNSTNPGLIQLQIYFSAKCAVLRFNHPDWSDTKIFWEASKDIVHISLDVFGLIPVIGEIADLTNGVLYTIEGDGLNATLSYGSAVPLAGLAPVGTKYAIKIVDASQTAYSIGTKVRLTWKVLSDGSIYFGSSGSKLRKVLGMAPIAQDARQAHHIIPWAKQSENIIQQAAKDPRAFHMNEALNGIPLDNSVHLGSHNIYDGRILERLNELNIAYPNISPRQAYDGLIDIISDVRTAIQNNPTTHINNLIF